jgi:hypothetical protein
LPAITRRHFQGAQNGYRCQRITRFHHGRIHIAPTGGAAAKPTAEAVMAFNPAGNILALNHPRQRRSSGRAAIGAWGVAATSLTPRRGGNTGKADDTIPKAERLSIKNANLRGFSRDWPICRGRAKKIGRQAKAKEKRRNHGASNTKPRTAKAGTYLPAFEDTPRFTHRARLTEFFAMLQLLKM